MSEVYKIDRSLRCNCEEGHPSNAPLIFPQKRTAFLEAYPCPCSWDNKTCITPTIICKPCQRPHRLDTLRDNHYSNFLCLWCGQFVLNLEREIREHCANCTHRPFPTVYIETDMCKCPKCPYQCNKAVPFQSCFDTHIVKNNIKFHHPTYPTEPQEIAELEAMTPQEIFWYARSHEVKPHISKKCPKNFKDWDQCRLGNPPHALRNDSYLPLWFDPEEIAAKMSKLVFTKPPTCPYRMKVWK